MSKKTLLEQVEDLKNTIAAKRQRQTEIMNKAAEEGRSTAEDEAQEFDGLADELKQLDGDLVRLQALHDANMKSLKPVAGQTQQEGTASRSGTRIEVRSNLPKGTAFTRFAMALAATKGNRIEASEFAKRWTDTPQVETILKAAVAAGTTTDPTWAAPLVDYTNMASEFIDLLRPMTIVGRIEGLRRVPFNIRMVAQTAGASVGWVGQGAPKPVGQLQFADTTLGWAKIAGIVVITEELARFSSPSAEATVGDDLRKTISQFVDVQFINPAVAEVAGVSPAAVTNGAPTAAASGTTADHLRNDLATGLASIIGANMSGNTLVYVMQPQLAIKINGLRNALGQREFPDVTYKGGFIDGVPVITSASVPAGVIAMIEAAEVMIADDGQVMLDVSREASLQMDNAPVAPSATTVMINLWQHNLVGLRAERYINWKRRRTNAVYVITGAAYTS
ncbi:MAG: phage major capsid protein [Alphaproteobacteria bacterium]